METNNLNTQKRYALITGGTSGIGYELAKLFVKDGYNLIIVARSNERLQEATEEFRQLGAEVLAIEKNLFDVDAAREIYQEVKSRAIQVDVLVNNAGQGQLGRFHEVPLERHLDLIQLDVVSLVTLTRLFLDDMVQRNAGKILNLASVVSKTPAPEFSVYAASKAFVLSFSEALAKELEDTNITITALMPGRTDTDFFYKADMTGTKEYQEHHLADPAEVARDGYDALMSGESRVISGGQNKMMIGMMNSMPDSANAANMQKNMQPSEKDPNERRHQPGHTPSQREREAMDRQEIDQEEVSEH
jgi:short-subunit dehydrogenase